MKKIVLLSGWSSGNRSGSESGSGLDLKNNHDEDSKDQVYFNYLL